MQNQAALSQENALAPPRTAPPVRSGWRWPRLLAPYLGILLLLAAWQGIVWAGFYPEFIIPPPLAVAERFVEVALDGRLWLHTSTTAAQVAAGFFLGATLAVTLGYFTAKSRKLEALTAPLFILLQSTPVVAYAPLLVIWFGSGSISKVVTSVLVVFFPLLTTTIVGLRSVPAEQRELMRLMNASAWQQFWKLEIPAALPALMGGLKVAATLALIGAVVGEFVSAKAGLGYLIERADFDFDTPLVFVAIITLAALARAMVVCVAWVERRLLRWRAQ